jgi:hypothetical protein
MNTDPTNIGPLGESAVNRKLTSFLSPYHLFLRLNFQMYNQGPLFSSGRRKQEMVTMHKQSLKLGCEKPALPAVETNHLRIALHLPRCTPSSIIPLSTASTAEPNKKSGKKCWETIAHAHIGTDHRVMSHVGVFEKLLSVDTYTG